MRLLRRKIINDIQQLPVLPNVRLVIFELLHENHLVVIIDLRPVVLEKINEKASN